VPNPDGIPCKDCGFPFNFDRCGVRIPLIAISPWIPKGTVVHEAPDAVKPQPSSAFDLTSIPATLQRLFYPNASFLSARDAWAAPLNVCT
jgi:phospholipase C